VPSRRLHSSSYSPVGWYVASYIHRFIVLAEQNDVPGKRFTIWENTVLVKATTPTEAYEKAVRVGKQGCKPYANGLGQRVRFVFEGLTSLLPVYEDIADGSEISWMSRSLQLKTVKAKVKSKLELEAFKRTSVA
jgi:Domain of unknown function (DUF4288)